MEGPLSKWTNVMQGWQYRWFVLDETAGVLFYYTSKEKMMRGQRRGAVRLQGAVVGIDDEDDSTFTITVDQKIFHFQGRDVEERCRWTRALEACIHRHSAYHNSKGKLVPVLNRGSLKDFDRRIAEADQYLQIMIDQVKELEERMNLCSVEQDRNTLCQLVEASNAMLESVKHSIVILQLAKNNVAPLDGPGVRGDSHSVSSVEGVAGAMAGPADARMPAGGAEADALDTDMIVIDDIRMPAVSYSSDEMDEFFDAAEINTDEENLMPENEVAIAEDGLAQVGAGPESGEPDWGDEGANFDDEYDRDEDELGNVQEQGSVITHLLGQIRIGMDLTRITLPTFILEHRSLLEMYADFFANSHLFVNVALCTSAEDRFLAVVKWYLSSFHAGRKSGVAKKPYNPILGESFSCKFNVPGLPNKGQKVRNGPVEDGDVNEVTFIAEQVSHHPPVSAFHAEHAGYRMQADAHIWTQSRFYGLSIAVHNVGQGCLKLLDQQEEYIVAFPSAYGRGILTVPWIELVGKTKCTCEKTGYSATIEFLKKPFYGGKAHQIEVFIYRPNQKKPYMEIRGAWNDKMIAKCDGKEFVFLDVHKTEQQTKTVKPVANQKDRESRRLWRHVTHALVGNDVKMASEAKHWIEQRQRDEKTARDKHKIKWRPKLPVDMSTLTEEERLERLAARKPQVKMEVEEQIDDSFSLHQYAQMIKKKKY